MVFLDSDELVPKDISLAQCSVKKKDLLPWFIKRPCNATRTMALGMIINSSLCLICSERIHEIDKSLLVIYHFD